MKKKNSFIYIFLIIFFIISITTIYSAQGILANSYKNLYIKHNLSNNVVSTIKPPLYSLFINSLNCSK